MTSPELPTLQTLSKSISILPVVKHVPQRKELFGNGHTPEQSLTLRPTHGEEILLQPGINYFLLTFDVRSKATPGHTLYASVPFFKLNGKKLFPKHLPKKYVNK